MNKKTNLEAAHRLANRVRQRQGLAPLVSAATPQTGLQAGQQAGERSEMSASAGGDTPSAVADTSSAGGDTPSGGGHSFSASQDSSASGGQWIDPDIFSTQKDSGGDWQRELREGFTRGAVSDLEISEVEYRRVALEKAYLVGTFPDTSARAKAEASLTELAALAKTAGAQVVGAALQRRELPDPATYIGKGKAGELADEIAALGADTLVVNAPLQPSQRRGLEDVVHVKVIDRTAVILDIFAQHAQSKEGKAQVELAQLEYLLPRLRGWGESMSRQAGGRVAGGAGIGSRGPGETKIELDRRRIKTRMAKLRRQLEQMKTVRNTKRDRRLRHTMPRVVIVGYTNAGKSSLINALVNADVMVQGALFATLDPTTRSAFACDGREYTISDTVGFIEDLPHELIEAFRSTLEEVEHAHLLLHVVDASHFNPLAQIEAVNEVLSHIDGAKDIPQLIVLNKIDLLSASQLAALQHELGDDCLAVSAHTGAGLATLREGITAGLPQLQRRVEVVLPYSHGALLARLHAQGHVDSVEYLEQGVAVKGLANEELYRALNAAAI